MNCHGYWQSKSLNRKLRLASGLGEEWGTVISQWVLCVLYYPAIGCGVRQQKIVLPSGNHNKFAEKSAWTIFRRARKLKFKKNKTSD